MRSEKEIGAFLDACNKVAGFGVSTGPCPLELDRESYGDDDDRCGCCEECSFPSGVEWVLGGDVRGNGQQELIRIFKEGQSGQVP